MAHCWPPVSVFLIVPQYNGKDETYMIRSASPWLMRFTVCVCLFVCLFVCVCVCLCVCVFFLLPVPRVDRAHCVRRNESQYMALRSNAYWQSAHTLLTVDDPTLSHAAIPQCMPGRTWTIAQLSGLNSRVILLQAYFTISLPSVLSSRFDQWAAGAPESQNHELRSAPRTSCQKGHVASNPFNRLGFFESHRHWRRIFC